MKKWGQLDMTTKLTIPLRTPVFLKQNKEPLETAIPVFPM
jgi:hypothetical protein